MPTEIWTTMRPEVGATVRRAQWAEAAGFDGIGFSDTQCLACDPFIELALAATATSRIKVSTSVTNPVTRHPAVMASMIATVQGESGGRAVLGIGRGDSALAHLGLAPASVSLFEDFLWRLQGYLSGDTVPFASLSDGVTGLRSVESMGVGTAPEGSSLQWLSPTLGKVPVFVAATGPRVIRMGARVADSVMFSVGAHESRVQWAIEQAEDELARTPPRSGSAPSLGAYVPLVVHEDRETARRLIAGKAAAYARFSVMHGRVVGPMTNGTDETLLRLNSAYDMREHSSSGSSQSRMLDDETIDEFAVAGPPDYVVERLSSILELGLSTLIITGPLTDIDPEQEAQSRELFASEVLPQLKGEEV